jgi:phosphopantothenoylcysteine decarboxylase/phosphopantothenate--cysteine ligase
MGYALAKAFEAQGAAVSLVTGPVSIKLDESRFHVHRVTTASEMFEATQSLHAQMDVVVFAAAVADFRPENTAVQKIKKAGEELTLRLVPNVDLALELGKIKTTKQIHVGFALETEQEEANAKAKLDRKNFDLVVLNSATEAGVGFKHDTNQVRIFHKGGNEVHSALLPKEAIAELILEEVKKAAS